MSDIDIGVLNAKVVSFADDTRLYSKISYVEDCDSLQSDLNCVYDWAKTNNMVFNSQKFKYLSFSTNVSITSEEISERAAIESRKLNLVVSGLDEPSASETTDNINTNDDDTQAVSMLFQTALNLKPYINKTIRLGRSTEGRPRLLCVTLNSAADRKEVLANAKKLREPQNQQFNQV